MTSAFPPPVRTTPVPTTDPSVVRVDRQGSSGRVPTLALILFDLALITGCWIGAIAFRTHPDLSSFWWYFGFREPIPFMTIRQTDPALLFFQAALLPVLLWAFRHYAVNPERSAVRTWLESAAIVAVVQATFIATIYILRATTVPHGMAIANTAFLLLTVPTWRAIRTARARRRLARGVGLKNVLLVGSDRDMQDVASEIIRDPHHGRRIVGFLSDDAHASLSDLPEDLQGRPDVWGAGFASRRVVVQQAGGRSTIMASGHSLKEIVAENVRRQPRHLLVGVGTIAPEDVAFALDGLCAEEVLISGRLDEDAIAQVIRACRDRGVDIHIVPQHYAKFGARPQPWALGEHTVFGLYNTPIPRTALAAKRLMDIAGSAFGLIVLSPILILAMLAIKIESPRGSVFYRGARVGYKGRHFHMLKLRTMVPRADQMRADLRNERAGPWFKLANDPRILRVGHFLRKYSIDEIPQFWNVFRGDMSLVGPRPLPVEEAASFVDYDLRYYRRLDVKPGMTGPWQISSRADPSFEKCIALDFEYMEKWSLWLDVKLLLSTPGAILFKQRGR